jgi:hypothetical protein
VTEAGAVDTDGLTLAGCDPLIVLSHLALYGVTAILEDAGHRDVRLGWTSGMDSRPRLHGTGLTAEDVAAAVRAHATRHIEPTSWIMADAADGKGALFAPRAARLTPVELRERDAQRRAWLDRLQGDGDHLSQMMVAALGGPASWARDPNTGEPAPNLGATPWDLQPRNNGADLVSTKLRPLARIVADRSVSAIRDGLVGAATVDELARHKHGYRTATGLAPLAPVDNAVMWCALWGISWHPLAEQSPDTSIDDAEQRAEALEKAATARKARSELFGKIKDGSTTVAAVLNTTGDDIVIKTKVTQVLMAVPGYGKAKVAELMGRLEIAEGQRVGELGSRQREALIAEFEQSPDSSIDEPAHARVVAAGHIATDGHGEWFYAPGWHTLRTPADVRAVISDERLRAAVIASLASRTGSLRSTVPMSGEAYLARLSARQPGAQSLVMWPIRNYGTKYAADRRAGRGFLLPLDVMANTANSCAGGSARDGQACTS